MLIVAPRENAGPSYLAIEVALLLSASLSPH
jgi:hypothetical protein